MDKVWPVKEIQLGKGVLGVWNQIQSLMKNEEVFVLRYNADDNKSGYIYFNSYDGESNTLKSKLKKYGLDVLTPYVKKGELFLMW